MKGDTEAAWNKAIAELPIDLSKELTDDIKAKDFKRVTGVEPRIAFKVDSSAGLPTALKNSGHFPLPIRNGVYKCVRRNGFHPIEEIEGTPKTFTSKLDFEMATATGTGESMYIHYAYNCGLLSEFTGVDAWAKSNEGRKRAKPFSFMVKDLELHQDGVQIQVDGLFEVPNRILVVEAKKKGDLDFIIRQLYYPYRNWRVETNQQVDTLFFVIDDVNDVYSFYKYHFTDENNYSSIELVDKAKYVVVEKPRGAKELEQVAPESPYIPQANTVDVIQQIPFLVSKGMNNGNLVAEAIGYRGRQGLYYGEAAEGLGLITRTRVSHGLRFELTDLGKQFVVSRPDKRNEIIATQMMKLEVINAVFDALAEKAKRSIASPFLTKTDVTRIVVENSKLSGKTPPRRAQCIVKWFEWLSSNYGVVSVKKGRLCFGQRNDSDSD